MSKLLMITTFESGAGSVNLEQMGLTELPENLEDLNWHIGSTNPMKFAVWNGHQFEIISGTFEVTSNPTRVGIYFGTIDTRYTGHDEPREYLSHLFAPLDRRLPNTPLSLIHI